MQVIAAVGHACIGQARDHCQVVLQRKALRHQYLLALYGRCHLQQAWIVRSLVALD